MMQGSPLSQNSFIRAAVICIADTDEPERQSVSALHHEIFSHKLTLGQDLKESLDNLVTFVKKYADLHVRFKDRSFAPVIEEKEIAKTVLAAMKRLYDSEKRQEDFKATVSAISAGTTVTVSDLYSLINEKKLAGFFFADVPVVGSYGALTTGKSSNSTKGKPGGNDKGKSKGKSTAASNSSAVPASSQSDSSSKPQAGPAVPRTVLDGCPPEWLATCDGITKDDKLKRYHSDVRAVESFLKQNQLQPDSYFWKLNYKAFPQCPPDLNGSKSKVFFLFAFKGSLPVALIECINGLKEADRTSIIQSVVCLMTITKSRGGD
jgi:hypothetical protein